MSNFQIPELIEDLTKAVHQRFEEVSLKGSGWMVKKIIEAHFHISRYQPIGGGDSTYVELPLEIQNKRAVLNIRNTDNECLLDCVAASLDHCADIVGDRQSNPNTYRATKATFDTTGLSFPTPVLQIKTFEKNNLVNINVYDYKNGHISPVRFSKFQFGEPINLLLYKGHYCLIKNLNSLLCHLNKCHRITFFCPYCIHGYSRRDLLAKHLPHCPKSGIRTTLPTGKEATMEFRNIHKQLAQPLLVFLTLKRSCLK